MSSTSPLFKFLGRTDDRCPYCLAVFMKRPQRKTKCLACNGQVYVRTRPLDEEKVLLTDKDAAALEEEWEIHYKLTSQQPRPISPEWQVRIGDAQAAGPHPDPEVEALSQRAMKNIIDSCLDGMAPRDATEIEIQNITNPLTRKEVEKRIYQMQVQYIFGKKYQPNQAIKSGKIMASQTYSLSFDKLPKIEVGRAAFQLEEDLSQALVCMPLVYARLQNAMRFLYGSMQNSDYLRCTESAASPLREGCLRAALTEIVSIEDMQKHDFMELGLKSEIIKLNSGDNPAWHMLRELRNLQVHLYQNHITPEPRDALWGNRERIEDATPINITIWTMEGIDLGAFKTLRNFRHYQTNDVARMIEWFNNSQAEWGVQELIALVAEDYCRTIISKTTGN